MSEPDLTITHSIRIEAPVARVWKILTEPEYVGRWLGCMRYRKALDHVFYMQQDEGKRMADDIDGATHCRIVALDEPKRFAFSWFLPGTPETTVSFTLASHGSATEVSLVHDGWEQFDAAAIREIRDALAGGWTSFVMPGLKRLAEASG